MVHLECQVFIVRRQNVSRCPKGGFAHVGNSSGYLESPGLHCLSDSFDHEMLDSYVFQVHKLAKRIEDYFS